MFQNGHLVTLATMQAGTAVGVTNLRVSDRSWSPLRDMINQGNDDNYDYYDDNDYITDGETILRSWTWTTLRH